MGNDSNFNAIVDPACVDPVVARMIESVENEERMIDDLCSAVKGADWEKARSIAIRLTALRGTDTTKLM